MNTEPDQSGSVPAVGDVVRFIADKSGSGNDAQNNSSSASPVLRQDANSKYYLEFDGIDDALVTQSNINVSGNSAREYIGGSGPGGPVFTLNPEGNNGERWTVRRDIDIDNLRVEIQGSAYVSGLSSDGVVGIRLPGGGTLGDHILSNGTTDENALGSNIVNTGIGPLYIGRARSNAWNIADFYGCTFIDKLLTAQQRADARQYYAEKRGVVLEGGFSPASLFAGGTEGAWYDPSDLSTLFQDSAGTTPVTASGQPVGKMLDKSGNGNHATQATAAARPTYQTGPARATLDKVDDRLPVTVPTGGFTSTMVLATDQGTASYGVTIPAGAYDIGGRGGQYFPGNAIVEQVIRDGALSAGEAAATEAYFVENGATASYGAVTDFRSFWRDWSEITSFPLIDTSAGTDFYRAWQGCSSLTSFPLIDTSAGTDFAYAWRSCSSLTSFPLIDTSAGTNFYRAWFGCSSLTSFPLIDTSSGTDFAYAWRSCSSLTIFPLIDTSSGTSFRDAWRGCSSLTTIPAGLFDNIQGGNFAGAFDSTALTQTSIDNILVSLVTSGISAGTRLFDQSVGSAPSSTGEAAIDTLRSRGWTVTVTGGY